MLRTKMQLMNYSTSLIKIEKLVSKWKYSMTNSCALSDNKRR